MYACDGGRDSKRNLGIVRIGKLKETHMASKSYGSLAQPVTRADILALEKTIQGVKDEIVKALERVVKAIESLPAKNR